LEESERKHIIELKVISNENEKLQSSISNFKIENEMLKGLLQEKSEILSSKDGFLNRLELQNQTLTKELNDIKVQNEKDLESLVTKDSENQEKIRLLTLNFNTRACDIARISDLRALEQKEAEKQIKEIQFGLEKSKNECEVLRKQLERLEKTAISREIELENAEKNLKEKENRRFLMEKDLEKAKKINETKEKEFKEELEKKTQENVAKNNERIIDLEVKTAELLKAKQELEQKFEKLSRENISLKEELTSEKLENQDIERKLHFINEEKSRFLTDYK